MNERWKILSLIILRILTGWHFLHEGISKLVDADWSSFSYLTETLREKYY